MTGELHLFDTNVSNVGPDWLEGPDELAPEELVGPWDDAVEYVFWWVDGDSGVAGVNEGISLGVPFTNPGEWVEIGVVGGGHQACDLPFLGHGGHPAPHMGHESEVDTTWGLCSGGLEPRPAELWDGELPAHLGVELLDFLLDLSLHPLAVLGGDESDFGFHEVWDVPDVVGEPGDVFPLLGDLDPLLLWGAVLLWEVGLPWVNWLPGQFNEAPWIWSRVWKGSRWG